MGSTPDLGSGSRRFKSCRSDHGRSGYALCPVMVSFLSIAPPAAGLPACGRGALIFYKDKIYYLRCRLIVQITTIALRCQREQQDDTDSPLPFTSASLPGRRTTRQGARGEGSYRHNQRKLHYGSWDNKSSYSGGSQVPGFSCWRGSKAEQRTCNA